MAPNTEEAKTTSNIYSFIYCEKTGKGAPKLGANRMGCTTFRKSMQSLQNKAKLYADATLKNAITAA